jgi:transcription elongation factor GreA
MNDQKIIMTKDGLEELTKELKTRIEKTREKIADDIARAREQGDLSENAAYTAALEAKQFNEARIEELTSIIKNSEVKKVNKSDRSVGIGEKVTIESTSNKEKSVYTIVGENQSDPSEGKISIKSPIGSAVLGKKEGDKFKVDLHNGTQEFKIIKIN